MIVAKCGTPHLSFHIQRTGSVRVMAERGIPPQENLANEGGSASDAANPTPEEMEEAKPDAIEVPSSEDDDERAARLEREERASINYENVV